MNFSTRYQRQEIAKARLAVLAEIHDLEHRLQKKLFAAETSENNDEVLTSSQINVLKQQVNSMHNCSMLLQVVDKQTTVSDHANPVKAMGFVAEVAPFVNKLPH